MGPSGGGLKGISQQQLELFTCLQCICICIYTDTSVYNADSRRHDWLTKYGYGMLLATPGQLSRLSMDSRMRLVLFTLLSIKNKIKS
mmetsp:Transcript_13791/g.22504  ORF Transcript_13791/g.22504 Transcript_13791/m.22504 type:complete len:87 (-) Transcript_13791:9-269(-)